MFLVTLGDKMAYFAFVAGVDEDDEASGLISHVESQLRNVGHEDVLEIPRDF